MGRLQDQSMHLKRIVANSRDTVSKLESRMRALGEKRMRAASDREDLEFGARKVQQRGDKSTRQR